MKTTTSFKIGENTRNSFRLECMKNNVNMSDVLENFMIAFNQVSINNFNSNISFKDFCNEIIEDSKGGN